MSHPMKNQISIDPSDLDLNVELSATEQEIIPRANSATLVTFNTQTGESLLFNIRMPDGNTPPMAAEVLDQDGQLVGYVAQAGSLFTRGLPEKVISALYGDLIIKTDVHLHIMSHTIKLMYNLSAFLFSVYRAIIRKKHEKNLLYTIAFNFSP